MMIQAQLFFPWLRENRAGRGQGLRRIVINLVCCVLSPSPRHYNVFITNTGHKHGTATQHCLFTVTIKFTLNKTNVSSTMAVLL